MELKAGSIWQHVKGPTYEIIALGELEWNREPVVIYHGQLSGDVWVRPKEQFLERFTWLSTGSGAVEKPDEIELVYSYLINRFRQAARAADRRLVNEIGEAIQTYQHLWPEETARWEARFTPATPSTDALDPDTQARMEIAQATYGSARPSGDALVGLLNEIAEFFETRNNAGEGDYHVNAGRIKRLRAAARALQACERCPMDAEKVALAVLLELPPTLDLPADLPAVSRRVLERVAVIAAALQSARNEALESAAQIAERTHSGGVASVAIRSLKTVRG